MQDFSNATKSITSIEGGDVTGRALGMGTTMLLVGLMRHDNQKKDKLNYELSIGARRFKCRSMPILRKDYGVVGTVCINIDVNYVNGYVASSSERTERAPSAYPACVIATRLQALAVPFTSRRHTKAASRHRSRAPRV